MTEDDWRTGTDPDALLRYLQGKVSQRKLRLFACACCRRVLSRLPEDWLRRAIEVSEAYADGQASGEELGSIRLELQRRLEPAQESTVWVREAAWLVAARSFPEEAAEATRHGAPPGEAAVQCALLRDLIGNPFRIVSLAPSWLRWHDHCLTKLAQAIYDDHRFEDLPILADVLLEAGCTAPAILDHCRAPGEHVRGCWVVDALLGRS